MVEKVKNCGLPVIVAYNKIDLIRVDEGEAKLVKLKNFYLMPHIFIAQL